MAVGTNPGGVAVNPAGTRAYVANNNSNNVSVIDTATNTVVATVAVGVYPYGVAVADVTSTSTSTVAPTCTVTALIAGPPKQQQVTVTDTGSGLRTIGNIAVTNGTVAVDPFTVGTTSGVHVTATKSDQTKPTSWSFDATDVAGNKRHCA